MVWWWGEGFTLKLGPACCVRSYSCEPLGCSDLGNTATYWKLSFRKTKAKTQGTLFIPENLPVGLINKEPATTSRL